MNDETIRQDECDECDNVRQNCWRNEVLATYVSGLASEIEREKGSCPESAMLRAIVLIIRRGLTRAPPKEWKIGTPLPYQMQNEIQVAVLQETNYLRRTPRE